MPPASASAAGCDTERASEGVVGSMSCPARPAGANTPTTASYYVRVGPRRVIQMGGVSPKWRRVSRPRREAGCPAKTGSVNNSVSGRPASRRGRQAATSEMADLVCRRAGGHRATPSPTAPSASWLPKRRAQRGRWANFLIIHPPVGGLRKRAPAPRPPPNQRVLRASEMRKGERARAGRAIDKVAMTTANKARTTGTC